MILEKLRQLSDKELNERFPFMICHKAFIDENDKDDLVRDDNGNVVNHFEDWGWRDIQLALAEHVKPIYDNMSDEEKQCFYLQDCKEKYSRLDNLWSTWNRNVQDWDFLAEYISKFTCIKCGKRHKDKKYYRINITKGWICPYCDDCKKEMVISAHYDEDDFESVQFKQIFSVSSYDAELHKKLYNMKDFFNLSEKS